MQAMTVTGYRCSGYVEGFLLVSQASFVQAIWFVLERSALNETLPRELGAILHIVQNHHNFNQLVPCCRSDLRRRGAAAMRAKIFAKIVRWIIFGLSIAILPLFFPMLVAEIKSEPITVQDVLGGGEALVIAWTMCAGAIGELFGNGTNKQLLKIASGGFCLLVLISSALGFAIVNEQKIAHQAVNQHAIFVASLAALVAASITGIGCIALSEV